MDFQAIVDAIDTPTCVMSVEKLEDGSCGPVRIVTGNRAYIDTIERPVDIVQLLDTTFIPNTEYTRYLTRDLNFESYCYRSAVLKKCLRSYTHPERLKVWFNMTFLPLDADDGNLSFCLYIMQVDFEPDSESLSSVSGKAASQALEAAIKLRSATSFDIAIKQVVADLRNLCGAQLACILLMDEEKGTCSILCEDEAEDTTLQPIADLMNDDFYELALSWKDTIAGSDCIIVKNKQDMAVVKERNPYWHQSLVNASVNSVVLFPLKSHNHLLGYIWVANFNPDDSTRIKETLELTTYVLAAELDNHLLLDQLKTLSSKDMLTGILNRNEMSSYLEKISVGEVGANRSVGVVFADLNGLKEVNDSKGHAAGDELLRNGTDVLQTVFKSDKIFRAGGDEFVVIALGVTQTELDEKIEQVRRESEKRGNVSFALGGSVEPDNRDVNKALHEADERMYEDKRAYYETHPRRRTDKRG